MTAADTPGPHMLPQHQQSRFAVEGRRYNANGRLLTGGRATLVFIRDPLTREWVCYFDTDPLRAIALPHEEVERLRRGLSG